MSKGQFQVDFLKRVLAEGGRIESLRFSMQRGPFTFPDPVYSITLEQHGVRSFQEFPWTTELESFLLFDLGRPADRMDEEAERFATILLNNLDTAAEEAGKDYANAVFVDLLRRRSSERLTPLLNRAPAPKPSTSSAHYANCQAFLRHSIDGLQNSAQLNLHHTTEETRDLVETALVIVLEETFHLSIDALPSRQA
jgi:hypothetical protein